ncbi:unnamed protein product [Gordionus sp. m RMFG-2023]
MKVYVTQDSTWSVLISRNSIVIVTRNHNKNNYSKYKILQRLGINYNQRDIIRHEQVAMSPPISRRLPQFFSLHANISLPQNYRN